MKVSHPQLHVSADCVQQQSQQVLQNADVQYLNRSL